MGELSHFQARFDNGVASGTGLIVVGAREEFSSGFVNMVAGELEARPVLHLPDLYADPAALTGAAGGRSVVLADAHRVDPDRHLAATIAGVTEAAHLLLTYRDAPTARALFRPVLAAAAPGRVSFLPRSSGIDVLFAILKVIARGGAYLPPDLVAGLAAPAARRADGPGLTERELEVIELISAGKTNKAVAHELQINECTVKLHVSNLMKKLKVRNRTAAVRWYLSS